MPTILPAIARRRSIRHFESKPVEPELIDTMLQAVEMGLGTCWVHHFEHDEVREHFQIPEHFVLMSLMAVGYPAAEVHPMERADLRWTPNK